MTTSLREQLDVIYAQHGVLTPTIVVDTARAENHPLHPRFEWDDTIAGEAWRRQQAHELIRTVKVTYSRPDEPTKEVRQFHAVRSEEGHVYHPADRIAQDPFMRELLLRDMERDIRQLQQRYGHMREFIDHLTSVIDAA